VGLGLGFVLRVGVGVGLFFETIFSLCCTCPERSINQLVTLSTLISPLVIYDHG
jgi:hypothetical protein